MPEKILVVDKSQLLRNFLKEQLEENDFEVILAKDGLDALIKMRNQTPDLVIMDFYLPKLNGFSFLKEKMELKTTTDIPVIILSAKMDKKTLIFLSRYKIYKVLNKPIEIDSLLQNIGMLFNKHLKIDPTECLVDIHLNDDILFIEVANGLNYHKISLVKYKIIEIIELYELSINKILLLFSNIKYSENFNELMNNFMNNVLKSTGALPGNISILTSIDFIINYFKKDSKFQFTHVSDNFERAIENLGKIDYRSYRRDKIDNVKQDLISGNIIHDAKDNSSLKLKFSNEKLQENEIMEEIGSDKTYSIAVVDDDLPILEFLETVLSQTGWDIHVYENGQLFVNDLKNFKPDLLFLDLFMPELSGFEVLEHMNRNQIRFPVIVLTAYPDKKSIVKARNYGVKSYLTKPVKAEFIIHKAEEILTSNF